ncbi:MAG: hypothetical protein WB762_04345 [Candidatus Sulfotelmatobacter sp.]
MSLRYYLKDFNAEVLNAADPWLVALYVLLLYGGSWTFHRQYCDFGRRSVLGRFAMP